MGVMVPTCHCITRVPRCLHVENPLLMYKCRSTWMWAWWHWWATLAAAVGIRRFKFDLDDFHAVGSPCMIQSWSSQNQTKLEFSQSDKVGVLKIREVLGVFLRNLPAIWHRDDLAWRFESRTRTIFLRFLVGNGGIESPYNTHRAIEYIPECLL